MLWGSLSAGRPPGARLARVRVDDGTGRAPGALRGLAALLLWPLTVLFAPVTLPWALLRRRRPPPLGAAAPHLGWTGLRALEARHEGSRAKRPLGAGRDG
jgi:hypothetical protein